MLSKSNIKQLNSAIFLALLASLLTLPAAQADLISDESRANEQAIHGSLIITTTANVALAAAAAIEDDSADFTAFTSSNLFKYEGDSPQESQAQYVEINFDQDSNDLGAVLASRIASDSPFKDLSFIELNVSEGQQIEMAFDQEIPEFSDSEEAFVKVINQIPDPVWYAKVPAPQRDTGPQADKIEYVARANTTDGNATSKPAGTKVSGTLIKYQKTVDANTETDAELEDGKDADADETDERDDASDLAVNTVAVPEPSTLSAMLLGVGLLFQRRRKP